jgi:DNA repair protein RadC
VLHHGTVDMSVVYPREVLSQALKYRAAAILVAHNHPGGSRTPSSDDLKITAELQKAAATLGIRLLDHLLVAESQVISFKSLGEL